ncbi:hypothetical protein F8568_037595 [Actinomadura sp. LD22]|uniref:Uncharacterized protein n=1 Tax=Actinomadura physcomitrii TaxID=2650748 RepID=A0A6I4MRI3_9ACTN|nr:hypothetical protein [Actinomadura physcomitrii]MWA05971.1 hypothetical protein [Actinomadura physcomitrii]
MNALLHSRTNTAGIVAVPVGAAPVRVPVGVPVRSSGAAGRASARGAVPRGGGAGVRWTVLEHLHQ